MDVTGIKQFGFSFSDLTVNPSDLDLLLGFPAGASPEPFQGMIREALSEAPGLFDIRAGYRRMKTVLFFPEWKQIEVGGIRFSPGRIVFNQIGKSEEVAFFLATAGHKISERCRRLYEEGDAIYPYVLDVLGSVVAEKAAEKMMDYLDAEVSQTGNHISESYSPGYCNWDVAEQQILFTFFPAAFCGITLSASSLMHPVKSVSGITGIGPFFNRSRNQCCYCSVANCFFGKIRTGGGPEASGS